MKRWLIIISVVIGLPIIGFAAYLVAYFTIPPSFTATAHKQANGDYRIEVDPNFVVVSVYRIEVSDSSGLLVERDEPREGLQSIMLPGKLVSGKNVTVTCALVYDRPMPSITTHRESLQLP